MKSTFLIIYLFFFSLVIFGQQRVYNSNDRFSIIPIENWENHSIDSSLVFSQPSQGVLDLYKENIQILTYPANGKSLDEIWDSWVIEDFPNSFIDYKVMNMGISYVDGKKAKWIEFINKDYNFYFRDIAYFLVYNDVLYYIICLSLERDFVKTENDFLKMISTLKIK